MKRTLLTLVAALAASAFTACSTAGQFENRLVRTEPCDMAFIVSLYGTIGVTSKLSDKDLAALCGKGAANASK